MKSFFIHFAILLTLAASIALLFSWQSSASLLIGGLLMMLNLAMLLQTWSMTGEKKLIALKLLIIVSKYTFLAMALYLTLKLPWIQPLALIGGVTLFVFSTAMTGLVKMKTETQ